MAHCRHVRDVWIRWIDNDATDVLTIAKTCVHPRAAAVCRSVHAVAEAGALPVVRFARADPYDIGIRRRQRDITDRRNILSIEERRPCRPGVAGLPHTTRC